MATYEDAIQVAADFIEELGTNPEYERGQCELIADLFGIPDVETGVRVEQIERDIRAHQDRHKPEFSPARIAQEALNGDSNDAEHDALVYIAETLGLAQNDEGEWILKENA